MFAAQLSQPDPATTSAPIAPGSFKRSLLGQAEREAVPTVFARAIAIQTAFDRYGGEEMERLFLL